MKSMTAMAFALAAAMTTAPPEARADAATQQQVRDLEQEQARAAITGDRSVLERLFAPDFVLVNPPGVITPRAELLKMLTGGTPYRSAKYETQHITDLGDTIVSIGVETVVANQGAAAGKEQKRRVTHVWHRDGGEWRLRVRHAHVID
jgi:uncharacterized protein (TIGR02246 family)